jgi:hydrogenase/urease accessory protein HupE
MKIISARLAFVMAALGAMASGAMAHPGDHSMGAAQLLVHLLTEPDHLAMMGVAALLGFALWRYSRSQAR